MSHLSLKIYAQDTLSFVHIPKTGGTWVGEILGYMDDRSRYRRSEGYWAKCKLESRRVYSNFKHCPVDPDVVSLKGLSPSSEKKERLWASKRSKTPHAIRFAVIRNPYDILCSSYFWNERMTNSYITPGISAELWCQNFINPIPELSTLAWKKDTTFADSVVRRGPQVFDQLAEKFLFYQLFGIDGQPRVDFILRYENINTGMKHILNQLTNFPDAMIGETMSMLSKNKNPLKREAYQDWYKSCSSIMKDIDNRFSRECLAFNYNFDGPKDDAVFLDMSGLRYNPVTNHMTILYPNQPIHIEFRDESCL